MSELRDASTVVLLRDSAGGIEVFLQRRSAGMAFSAGATVFPGGGVDPTDAEADLEWAGPSPEWWASRWNTDLARARALVVAAVRETFEESGVLLAGPTPDTVVGDTSVFEADRVRIEKQELALGEFLRRHALVLRADLLRPWSNWITPEGEGRRYDTRFFVAALPDGQRADGVTSEADATAWKTPAAAIGDWAGGASLLMPPTWSQLASIDRFATVAELFTSTAEISPVMPVIVQTPDGRRVRFAGHEAYYAAGGPDLFRR